jgi:hypothetical protein
MNLFREVLRVNRNSKLEKVEVRAIDYKDGWFGHNYEDVIIAKVVRDKESSVNGSGDIGVIGTIEEVEQAAA